MEDKSSEILKNYNRVVRHQFWKKKQLDIYKLDVDPPMKQMLKN